MLNILCISKEFKELTSAIFEVQYFRVFLNLEIIISYVDINNTHGNLSGFHTGLIS